MFFFASNDNGRFILGPIGALLTRSTLILFEDIGNDSNIDLPRRLMIEDRVRFRIMSSSGSRVDISFNGKPRLS